MLTSRPAEIFSMKGKGSLAPGADGDVTLVDLEQSRVVDPAALASYSDYSLYEGWTLRGWPVRAILRGETIMQDGRVVGAGGMGVIWNDGGEGWPREAHPVPSREREGMRE
ncbi:hypothetical protein ACFSLT_25885 [Novosphingobium resinovorum]